MLFDMNQLNKPPKGGLFAWMIQKSLYEVERE
jgi:hypothetical protein